VVRKVRAVIRISAYLCVSVIKPLRMYVYICVGVSTLSFLRYVIINRVAGHDSAAALLSGHALVQQIT